MTDFIIYLIKVVLSSSALYLFYQLLLKNSTYFRLNRYYLLLSSILPIVIPFIKIPSSQIAPTYAMPIMLDEIVITANGEVVQASNASMDLTTIIYISLGLIFLARLLIAIFSISRLYINSEMQKFGDHKLLISSKKLNPFSFFSLVFVSTEHFNDPDGFDQIILHEKTHIRQLHSIDVIIMEIICSVFWINPIFWIIKDKLKSTHEYLADEKVMEQNFDLAGYFMLLFENVVGKRIGLANNFNESLTLKRMKMMKKNRSPRYLRWLYLMVLPLVGVVVFAISCTENTADIKEVVDNEKVQQAEEKLYEYTEVEEAPVYLNGDEDLITYLSNEITYPEQAKLDGTEGKVFIKFTINKTGEVVDAFVVEPVNELLDAEALRVISEMPNWIPGMVDDKAVNVEFVIPINFKLQ